LVCAPYPAGEAYSALPDLLAVFKGPTFKRRKREGKGEMKRRVGLEKGGGYSQLGSLDPPVEPA